MSTQAPLRRSLALLCLTALTGWSLGAAGSSTFPAEVDQHLKLSGSATIENAVAPPHGCLLCHTTEQGGFMTNNAFGAELRQQGAIGTRPSTVGPALDAVEMIDPRAIDDIRMGINPNDDHSNPTTALPQPSFGCSLSADRGGERRGGLGWLGILGSVALLWLRGARRPARGAAGSKPPSGSY